MYAGPEFDLSTRVSQILNTVFTCYMYSGGMPLLNIICFVTLLCVYWVDKYLVLRYYRTPPLYSYQINKKVLKLIPYAILIHCGFSIYMYGAADIFPKEVSVSSSGYLEPNYQDLGQRIKRTSGVLMMTLFVLTVLIMAWFFVISKFKKRFKSTIQVADAQTRDDQGTYKQNLNEIREHGIPSYHIMMNPSYKPILVSLNDAASDIKKHKIEKQYQPQTLQSPKADIIESSRAENQSSPGDHLASPNGDKLTSPKAEIVLPEVDVASPKSDILISPQGEELPSPKGDV